MHLICDTPGKFPEEKRQIKDIECSIQDESLPKVEKHFEHLDHTADIQIHSWGNNLAEAFCNQILGMFEYMVPLERIQIKNTLTLEASAPNDKNLNGKKINIIFTFYKCKI